MNIVLTVPVYKYIRQVKVSEKQRASYYLWDGKTIRARGKRLPLGFLTEEAKQNPIVKQGLVKPEFLKPGYFLIDSKNKRDIVAYETEKEIHENHVKPNQLMLAKYEGSTFEPVIANREQVGTPRYIQIKGQDIYSGNTHEHTRAIIISEIKKTFVDAIRRTQATAISHNKYPLILVCEVHDTVKNVFDGAGTAFGLRWDVGNRIYPYMKAFPDSLVDEKILVDDDRLHITGEQFLFCPIDNQDDRKLVFHLVQDLRPSILNNSYYNGVIKNIPVTKDKVYKGKRDNPKRRGKELKYVKFKNNGN